MSSKYCQETVIQVEKSLWEKLKFWTKWKVQFHLWYCKNCADYKKDSTILHQLLCKTKSTTEIKKLNPEEKERLKNALN